MKKRFEPIEGRNAEIIESVMTSEEVASLNDELQFKIRLCVEEVEENILCYSGTQWIELEVTKENGVLTIFFKDEGIAFDPLAKDDPDINASLENRQVGGLGIFICKQMMDKLEYTYEHGCNCFTMIKKID